MRAHHARLFRSRSRNHTAIIASPQPPQRKTMRAEVIDARFQVRQTAADQIHSDLIERAGTRRCPKYDLPPWVLLDLRDACRVVERLRQVVQIGTRVAA